jgi:tetratricopeptide (TPR) repeat protein
MEIINDIVRQLDKHAAKQYKVFAGRTSGQINSRKDFKLFDMLRKSDIQDESRLIVKLYGQEDRNSYYRLKNRIAEDIGLSIFIQQHAQDEHMLCHYLTGMGHYYIGCGQFKIAFYYFKKAEKKAIESENYGLLDIIYSNMIKLARELATINPENYIKLRKDNRVKQNRMAEIEDILEALEYRIKISQNLSKNNLSATDLLAQILEDYTENKEIKNSRRVQFGVYFIISRTLLQQEKYEELESYLMQTLATFDEQGLFNKANHQHKLQILTWIANTTFKNRKYSLSLEFAEKLHKEMGRFDRLYFEGYEFYYYNILVINYSAINQQKAVEVLQQMAAQENLEKHISNAIFIYGNLAVLYFKQKDFKRGIESVNKLYRHSGYETVDPYARLSMHIGELMMRYEMKEFEFLEYRLKQVIKENKDVLELPEMASEKAFFSVLGKMSRAMGNTRDKTMRQKIVQFLEKYPVKDNEEKNLFEYNKWLSGKL